jgi:hypothetical protein
LQRKIAATPGCSTVFGGLPGSGREAPASNSPAADDNDKVPKKEIDERCLQRAVRRRLGC